MSQPDPMLRPETHETDTEDRALRPQLLADFVGQAEARANLRVFIESARMRGQAMDHTLFHGPPGLGKTTLAQIMARELGVNFKMTSGPVLARAGDLAAILTNLESRDVLFIDEIHRMNPAVEEILYPAMEDFELDLVIGEGPAARTVRIELQPFTLVGATTRLGLLTTPLRDRFGIPTRLQFYTIEELDLIVTLDQKIRAYEGFMDHMEIRKSAAELRAIWVLGNEYLQSAAPWSTFKTDPVKAAMQVRLGLNLIRLYAVLSAPFIPFAADAMLAAMRTDDRDWPGDARSALEMLPAGHAFAVPEVLFAKIADEQRDEWQDRFKGIRS